MEAAAAQLIKTARIEAGNSPAAWMTAAQCCPAAWAVQLLCASPPAPLSRLPQQPDVPLLPLGLASALKALPTFSSGSGKKQVSSPPSSSIDAVVLAGCQAPRPPFTGPRSAKIHAASRSSPVHPTPPRPLPLTVRAASSSGTFSAQWTQPNGQSQLALPWLLLHARSSQLSYAQTSAPRSALQPCPDFQVSL